MTPFELDMPASLEEAIGLLDPDDSSVRPIAGGTALMLMMKAGVFRPTRLVSLARAGGELTRIASGPNGDLTVGAMTPLATLERSREVAASAPGDRAHHAAAFQHPRAQCRDGRRRIGAWRSAYGPAARAHRARRQRHGRGSERPAHAGGRGFAHRLLRDRAGEERADRRRAHSGARQEARGVYESHHRLGRRLARARRRGRARSPTGLRSNRRVSLSAPRPRKRHGSRQPKSCSQAQASTTSCSPAPAMRPSARSRCSATCAARRPTSANCCASTSAAPSRRRWQATEHSADGVDTDCGRTDRTLLAAARSARQGDGPRRIHPHHAAARHAARKNLPQHRAAWAHQIDRHQRGKENPGRLSRHHRRGRRQGHSRSVLRPCVPRPADPGARQGPVRRRTRRRGARHRSARSGSRDPGDHRRI